VRDAAEAKRKCKRRLKRGDGKKGEDAAAADTQAAAFNTELLILSDELEPLPSHTIRCAAKVRGFAFDPSQKTSKEGCKALVGLINNSLEVYHVPFPRAGDAEDAESDGAAGAPSKISVVDLHGHR
jgi:hypothetical protein